jgi:urease accessory protein
VPGDALVGSFAGRVRAAQSDGNLAVVHGTLARAVGVSTRDAVLIELRGAAASLLSAALRLAMLTPTAAQVLLTELSPAISTAADRALSIGIDELSATTPELELYSLMHARAEARLFRT